MKNELEAVAEIWGRQLVLLMLFSSDLALL